MNKAMNRTILMISALFIAVLLPMNAYSAGAVKFRHILSVYEDENKNQLMQPEGVACDDESLFVVADTGNSRLLRFTVRDREVKAGTEIRLPQLTHPVRVQLNSRGEIYVLDGRERHIVRINPDGGFIGYLEPAGLPSQSSYFPRGFYIDEKDNIYILDIFSERVLILDPEGRYERHIDFPADSGFFSDVSVNFKGNILLIDSVNARVYSATRKSTSFSPLTESMSDLMRFPTSLATDRRGRIYLSDQNGGRIIILGQDGSFLGQVSDMGWKEGLLNYPSQLCINNREEIFIADMLNSRIQMFIIIK